MHICEYGLYIVEIFTCNISNLFVIGCLEMTHTNLLMAPLKFIIVIILGFLCFSNCIESIGIIQICNVQKTREECIRSCDLSCRFFHWTVGVCELNEQKSYSCCCKKEKPPIS
ncbi:hypothetical protein Lalb_Chr22g0358691 [Lupinus albus]|uniref:Uncharacterized protein n=1 Tax=Lupinus albus TaxID=3870 RepID=A0A6A4NIU0_LUPAL|nr:hypothetical protein Lalb_Chr22g0358691 [Lupinus albus]